MSKIEKTIVNALSNIICHNCDHQMIHTDDEGSFSRQGSSWDYYTCPKCLSGSSIYIDTFEEIGERINYELASNRDIQRAPDKEKNGMVVYRMVEEEEEDEEKMTYHIEINDDEYKLLMDLKEKGYNRLMARNYSSGEVITIVAYNSAKHEYLTVDSFSFMDDPEMNFSINELIKLYRKENGLALATGAVTIDTKMVQSEEYQKQLKKSREVRERARQRESLLNEIHAGNSSLERTSDMIDEIVGIDEAKLLNRIINNGKFKVADGTYLVISQPVLPKFAADYLESMKNKGSDLALSMQGSYNLVREWLFEEEDGVDNQIQYALSYFNDYTIDPDSIPKYYALIKGHDKINHDDKYWNYDTVDKTLEVGDNKVHKDVERDYILMATIQEWNELGINEDNAEFTINGIEVEK